MRKLLNWLDNNLLLYLAGFLLVFIPLYPKIPLLEAIPGYIVRVRLEDLLIAVTLGVWFIQLVRKKARLHPLITKLILAYLAIGFLSVLSAIFITKTIPTSPVHVAKAFLHFFRRIEYFSLFFVFYSAIHSVAQAKKLVIALLFVLLAVAGYGYGQKYLYWPVYSTMNREFSKGWKLYLTEHARVPSTFGGHYDAAAYTMIASIIAVSIFFLAKNKWLKLLAGAAYVAGFWLLILTASRTSFIGYLAGVTLLFFMLIFVKSWRFAIPRWFGVMVFSMFVMLSFGDLNERFAQVLKLDKLKEKYYASLFTAKVQKPADYITVDEIDMVASKSDTPPSTVKPTPKPKTPGDALPADVYEDIPLEVPILNEQGEQTGTKIVPRDYSENAHKYGLSAAIRLDALWPRAIAGFKSNPLLGSGYSTLTKESVDQFTEAESTDNDFLRALGETGLLGFLTFFGTVVIIPIIVLRYLKQIKDPLLKATALGFVAATVALLLNAIYIDVFEASKVAQSYWALAGLVLTFPLLSSLSKPIGTAPVASKAIPPKAKKSKKTTKKKTKKQR